MRIAQPPRFPTLSHDLTKPVKHRTDSSTFSTPLTKKTENEENENGDRIGFFGWFSFFL
jgi:hypothetical protein